MVMRAGDPFQTMLALVAMQHARPSLSPSLLDRAPRGVQPHSIGNANQARLNSPSGKLQAVYAEDLSGGPATGVSEDVYIVEPGHFPRVADRVYSQECVHDLSVAWEASRTLRISYSVSAGMHVKAERERPATWWAPWLWAPSPAGQVQVQLVQHVVPGNDC